MPVPKRFYPLLLTIVLLLNSCAAVQGRKDPPPPDLKIAQELLESVQRAILAPWIRQVALPFWYGGRWVATEEEVQAMFAIEFGRGKRTRLLAPQPLSLAAAQAQAPGVLDQLPLGPQGFEPERTAVILMVSPQSVGEVDFLLISANEQGKWQARGWHVCMCESLYRQYMSQAGS